MNAWISAYAALIVLAGMICAARALARRYRRVTDLSVKREPRMLDAWIEDDGTVWGEFEVLPRPAVRNIRSLNPVDPERAGWFPR